VILGGTLAEAPELAERLHELLNAETLGGRRHPAEVRRSQLGEDAAIVGAASSVLAAVVADPTLVSIVPGGVAARNQESA